MKSVILFDGVCNLCNGFVQTTINVDPQGKFQFAALQSEFGQEILTKANLPIDKLNTVILYDNGKIFTHSDVPLEICRRLGGFWRLLLVFKLIPRALRNRLYNWVASNRYRWFGKSETCMIPTPELRKRFL
ncbi:thiol-disulfide oxidoreductase DCC family protein [Haliscomenobacter sp.]|uniref:thiol-disulfide oxidoreductase DCC family protein n=1 Tax=Haliscomenobacter sp. TaxID=2717303 RepID=UPI003364B4BE